MQLKDERGMMAIGVALTLIVVLSLFGGVLWQYGMFELRRVQRAEADMQALFLARAGAEAVMGAWKKRLVVDGHGEKYAVPIGQMETLYYDLDNDQFTSEKPANYLGTIDVVVKKEEATDNGGDFFTVIEASARVGAASRTVRLVTLPHRYGHDPTLGWYTEETGEIQATIYTPRLEPVIMRTKEPKTPISFGKTALQDMRRLADRSEDHSEDRSLNFTASAIVFESPLQLMRDTDAVYDSPGGNFYLVLEAERIFLQDLEVAYLPLNEELILDWPDKYFSVVFEVPEQAGFLGSEIKGKVDDGKAGKVVDGARYGEVYFGSSVKWQNYRWLIDWFIFIPVVDIRTAGAENLGQLENQAFFFRDGWSLIPRNKAELFNENNQLDVSGYIEKSINDGWLIPIKTDAQMSLEEFKDLRPFFWEQ